MNNNSIASGITTCSKCETTIKEAMEISCTICGNSFHMECLVPSLNNINYNEMFIKMLYKINKDSILNINLCCNSCQNTNKGVVEHRRNNPTNTQQTHDVTSQTPEKNTQLKDTPLSIGQTISYLRKNSQGIENKVNPVIKSPSEGKINKITCSYFNTANCYSKKCKYHHLNSICRNHEQHGKCRNKNCKFEHPILCTFNETNGCKFTNSYCFSYHRRDKMEEHLLNNFDFQQTNEHNIENEPKNNFLSHRQLKEMIMDVVSGHLNNHPNRKLTPVHPIGPSHHNTRNHPLYLQNIPPLMTLTTSPPNKPLSVQWPALPNFPRNLPPPTKVENNSPPITAKNSVPSPKWIIAYPPPPSRF